MKTKPRTTKTGRRNASPAKPRSHKWILRLYIAGQTPRAAAALKHIKLLCEQQLDGNYRLEVVDLLKKPHLARANGIVAIPTLIRSMPRPPKSIIGDLSQSDRMMAGLDLPQRDA